MSFQDRSPLLPGFLDPVAGSQKTFRSLLKAFAYPGTIETVPDELTTAPAPLDLATAAIALSLIDPETPLWCDDAMETEGVLAFLRFHCGAPLVSSKQDAAFALIAQPDSPGAVQGFFTGTDEEPERAATLIVQVRSLGTGRGLGTGRTLRLSGPGIQKNRELQVEGLSEDTLERLVQNAAQYPLGLDWIFVAERRFVALPRSIKIEV